MSLSEKERDRRHTETKRRMGEKGVDSLLVFGDAGDWGLRYGNLRYLTNSKVIFGNSALIFPMDQEPLMFMFSGLQATWAKKLSWIRDARFSANLISDIVQGLKALHQKTRKLGVVSLSSLPLAWHERLRDEFPAMGLVEMGPDIEEMRYLKGEEEIELAERSAHAADQGFEEVVRFLKPGMSEFEVLSVLEGAMKAAGGDDFFDLIASGPFGPGVKLVPFAITGRKEPSRMIQTGDSVLLEITPRYGGYWSQLVRVVNVGKENPLLARCHRAARDGIEAATRCFKPGVRLGQAAQEAKKVIESAGLELRSPMGHIRGLNLVESRVELESQDILQPGMIIIFHPIVGSGEMQMFSGETYVITPEGCRCLNEAPDPLPTL